MKILVTGSKGFIGQNLIKQLQNDYEIQTYDILEGYCRPNNLSFDDVDCVIHLGACSSTTETNVEKVLDLNVSWAIELFELCVEKNITFQWASSASVYGKAETFNTNQQLQPSNLYARSKALLESYIVTRQAPIVWQGFRYFNVYGMHEDHKGTQASPYHQFSLQAKETGVIRVFEGSENYLRDFVSVETVCQYHKMFLEKAVSGIFNIGTGQAKSFMEVAQEVAEMNPETIIQEIPFPDKLKNHYQKYTCADMSNTNHVLFG